MMIYDKSIMRLFDACKNMLCGKYSKSILLIYSENKSELSHLCNLLFESISRGCYVSRYEIAQMLVEAIQEETKQDTIRESKTDPLLFLVDFEVIAGKERSQNIIYEILRQRFAEAKKTIIFTTKDVFEHAAFLSKIQVLLEVSDKFQI